MSSFFGIIIKTSRKGFLDQLEKAFSGILDWYNVGEGVRIGNRSLFGNSITRTTVESINETLPFYHDKTGCCLVMDSRIDYRESLASMLNRKWDDVKNLPDSYFIFQAYLEWGQDCVKYIYGDFSFAVWDERKLELICAIDHFGCRPLYYLDHSEYFVFSSEPNAFKALPNFKLKLKENSILEALCSIVPDKDDTVFRNVSRLEPAHFLVFKYDRRIQISNYWKLVVNKEYAAYSEEMSIHHLKELFRESVRQRSRSLNSIGVELSGGLDSSSITACLREAIGDRTPILAFSHGISRNEPIRSPRYTDENIYSDLIVSLNSIETHHLITGKDQTGAFYAIEKALINLQKPLVQSFALMSDLLLDLARSEQVNVLLSGFGGDEVVTNSGISYIKELRRRKEYKKLRIEFDKIYEAHRKHTIFRNVIVFLKLWTPWLFPLIKRNMIKARFNSLSINGKILKRYSLNRKYYQGVHYDNGSDVRTSQYKRLVHPSTSDRLENSYFASKVRGIEYRYPFLDVRLIEFHYSLSSDLKFKNGVRRYIFREAMSGILPEKIRLREDKTGTTIPNVMYRILKDEIEFRNIIQEGSINNNYHFVDYDKLNWMLDQFKEQDKRMKMRFAPKNFITPISILILQKWQREGKIDIGIKC